MKIAVVGAGITGMGAAYALSEDHDVHLFERDSRFGGHANTVEAHFGDVTIPVDTGFIVYNYRNYPNLTGLFDHLGVPTKWSDMSFGLSVAGGRMEYACDGLNEIFAQRSNIFRPRFLRGLREIMRFNRTAATQLDDGRLAGLSMGDYLRAEGYSDWFRDCFILPMGGAIWSTPTAQMLDFPAESFVAFFRNHDLMTGLDPSQRWRTVEGGSREYVSRLMAKLGPRAHAGAEVVSVTRTGGKPHLRFADGSEAVFDQVLLACHGPQAHRLLADASDAERNVLACFRTSQNRAVLHSDEMLMPVRRKVWSSWNFLSPLNPAEDQRPAPVTYWMNRLQTIDRRYPLFVSLNPTRTIDPAKVHVEFDYAHPVFDGAAFAAQREMPALQGVGGVWYAGAWLGYGFHEDGLRAGLRVAASLGARPEWARDLPAPERSYMAEAAE
ncbi:FAD-dependent oxidoreductase [Halovulum dunhuangense]|uniref:FAD-dependent oxidoreductase n=1 Tax=Halovulum dunhuangense TaxID=1505036 RepID=A0A849L177_9RHOB|nr:FAD-dependent oxidoreductase [Halovulum dunhuangense]NNU80048.1 FAD-dependent oxidoreductase [Halovulum dunhuangense]